jgi:hypothetical protein
MPRRRSIETRERDAQAVEYRRNHLSYPQIAAALGYKTNAGAYQAVQRGLADMHREPADEVRQLEVERLDAIARGFQRVFATRHYVVAPGGKVVRNPDTGELLIDPMPNMQAGLALLRVQERRAKYLGLDAPVKVEHITLDSIENEIRRLELEMGRTRHDDGVARRD